MPKDRDFNPGEPVRAWFTDALQELISGALFNLQLTRQTATTVRIPATATEPSGAVIGGRFRYRTANLDLAHPAGAAGQYSIYVSAATANSVSVAGGIETDTTDRTFTGSILAGAATPAGVVAYRKVGETTWDGAAITAITPMVPGMLVIGTAAGQAAPGNDVRFPAGVDIVNADIAAAAAIAYSKLNLANAIVNGDIAAAAAIAYSKLSLANSIVNGDIAAAAAIARSKLNFGAGLVDADIAPGAGIVRSKLSFGTGLVDADIAAAAAIVRSKLNFGAGLVNADIAAAAAIAYSKLTLTASIVNADVAALAAIAYSKLNLTASIVNADISGGAAIAESKLNLASDAAVGVASRRSLGGGSTQAAPGDDPRFFASGDLVASARSAARTGWLLCDGSVISRFGVNAPLFAAIGTAYGAGDGSTTFAIPDFRGRAAYGLGTHPDVDTLGKNDGLAVGSRRSAPVHTHTLVHHHVVPGQTTAAGGGFTSVVPGGAGGAASTVHTHDVAAIATGDPDTSTTSLSGSTPGMLVVNWFIKL